MGAGIAESVLAKAMSNYNAKAGKRLSDAAAQAGGEPLSAGAAWVLANPIDVQIKPHNELPARRSPDSSAGRHLLPPENQPPWLSAVPLPVASDRADRHHYPRCRRGSIVPLVANPWCRTSQA